MLWHVPYATILLGFFFLFLFGELLRIAFAPGKEANGGLYLSPSVGIQLKISHKLKVNLAIGYELQKLKRVKKDSNEYFTTEFEEQLSHNSITFKIGLTL